MNKFDFVFTLNSIFEKLFFTKLETSIPGFISLAKKHPTLRTENLFASLLNNYLIVANIQKLTHSQSLPKSLPEAKGELPDSLQQVAPELQSAWRKAKFIENTIIRLFPNGNDDTVSYLGNSTYFDKIIGECLIDDNWSNANTINDYSWGNWCAVGSGNFVWQKLNFLVLHRIHLGKSDEGLALLLYAWLSQSTSQHFLTYDFDDERWDNILSSNIQKSGSDWQSPACGMLLMHSRWINSRHLATKARQKTAQLLSLTGQLQLPDPKETLEVLVGILKRHSIEDIRYLGDPFAESEGGKFALNSEIKSNAIQTVASLIHKVEYGSELIDAIELLAALAPKTSKNDLLQLISSPVPSLSQAAYDALKANGYENELKPITPSKQESFELTLRLGGKPISSLPIYTKQFLITKDRNSFTVFGGQIDDQLGGNGEISFKRNDHAHASDTRGVFAIYPRGKEHLIPWTPTTPVFAYMENFADLKKHQNQIIDLLAHSLDIKLQFPKNRLSPPENAQAAQIIIGTQPLFLADSEMSIYFHAANYKLETRNNHFKMDQVGPACYSFHVQAPGCAIYTQTEPIAVTQNQEILIKLKPGHQLKYSLDSKENEAFSITLMLQSFDKKGKAIWSEVLEVQNEWQFINWNHLESGKYELHVFNMLNHSLKPSKLNFEIKPSDPEIVDLGKIKVPR
ncbi:MAG: hypothetical protein L3J39_03965 [Verrucomicrobiales bacterium]|nr:hypothetical protein [Verrucomicrobiales bacterium]